MNNIYIYNDNFISLLNLINYLIKNNIKPLNIKNSFYSPSLFDNLVTLEINDNKNIFNLFERNILKRIYYVFLSENRNKELIIYYFVLNYYKYGETIIYRKNLKCVYETLKIANYVSRENHKFKGFVRFKVLENNILYAEIEPENNILEILSMHFIKRLKNELWIIHDKRRKIVSLYDKKNFHITVDDNFKLLNIQESDNEENIQNMWKTFYKTIGIHERKNDRCRMNFMPKKYWKNILEMSDEI